MLILRTLIILFVILAFARPAVNSAFMGSARSSTVVIIDNSASMQYVHNGERIINTALRKAREIIEMLGKDVKLYINPTGRFEVGGPRGDTGLTGRKIVMDTYGGVGSHGGGCFSGKDPTKVDRSASYAARYIAKTIVAGGIADKCEIQIAYAIGVAEPVSFLVNTGGTGKIPEDKIRELILKNFDLTPHGIIKMLDLHKPVYKRTAVYGHFGRDEEGFTWEKTDKAELLKKEAGL